MGGWVWVINTFGGEIEYQNATLFTRKLLVEYVFSGKAEKVMKNVCSTSFRFYIQFRIGFGLLSGK